MLFKEIEAIFTQKVNELIQKGYTFNCNTMSGHQGEIAKVDLRKGNEIIRVLMCTEYSRTTDTLSVIVGRAPKNCGTRRYDTIWNGNLEIIDETKFYKVSENFYVETEAEIKAINDKQRERYFARDTTRTIRLNDAAAKIVLPFVRRQNGFKTCKVRDIDRVEKLETRLGTRYQIIAKGKTLTLNREGR